MKVTIIHGQSHKSSTYNIARQLYDKLDGEITEFFLPKDFECYCKGCATCFVDETRWEMLNPKIKRKIDNKTNLLAKKILSRTCKVKPTIKTRVFLPLCQ